MHRARLLLATLLAVTPLVACGERESALAPHAARRGLEGPTTALVVEADLPIERLDVTISDEQGSRDVELKREAAQGLLAGAVDVIPGARATLAFRAYDVQGRLTHEGKGELGVEKDVTPQREFELAAVPGAAAASVRVGSYRLALSRTELDGQPGVVYDMEATLLDARGERHAIDAGTLEWTPPANLPDIGAMDAEWGDDGIGGIPVKIRFLLEKWYMGRMKICHLGDGTCGIFYFRDPTAVMQLAAGAHHTCALRRSGRVSCWGRNTSGQLGSDASSEYLPLFHFVQISAMYEHTCGVDDTGAVRCWGLNLDGALGLPVATTSSAYPHDVVGLPATARMVTAGGEHSCALLTNGETWCWGTNIAGQLGDSSATGASPVLRSTTPVKVKGGVTFTAIGAGLGQTCGLDAAGAAWCWGSDEHGEAGTDSVASDRCPAMQTTPYPSWRDLACNATPRQLATRLRFVEVSGGHDMSCARTAGGVGYCWGEPYFATTPAGGAYWEVRTQPGMPTWNSFVAGDAMQCGVDTSGMVQCFGGNFFGQLGAGVTGGSTTWPAPVALVDYWFGFENGWWHGCGIRAKGSVVACWGNNSAGQLGAVTAGTLSNVPIDVTASY